MQQQVYKTVAGLIHAGTKLSGGAATHALALELVVGTKILVDNDLNGLVTATNAHLSGVAVLRERRTILKQATVTAHEVASNIRDALKRSLGRSYSAAWEGTGFPSSLQISRNVARLEQKLRSLQGYLTDHPELEVANFATAVIAGNALQALTAANTAVTVQMGTVKGLLAARRRAEKTMHLRVRGVVEELKRVIGGVDGRWEAFGLNQPGLKQAPAQPENVTVEMIGNDAAIKWDKTPRAERYRVWVKVIGVDEEAHPVGNPRDNDFMMEDVPTDAQLEVSISAANNGGESARSVVVMFSGNLPNPVDGPIGSSGTA